MDEIEKALAERFVNSGEVAAVLSLAIASERNLLLWGPPGHGKSQMVEHAFRALGETPYIQSCGEGLDESSLWGGIDLRALETEHELRYHAERSFLSHRYAVLEEIFDAPASVLLALKDTLTARQLRKGAQQFPMRTRVVIGITNMDPSEMSSLGPCHRALTERFPLQHCVQWDSYSSAAYAALLAKAAPPALNVMAAPLAAMLADTDETVSPRTAVHAAHIVCAAATARGSSVAEECDLAALRFVAGLPGAEIAAKAAAVIAREAAKAELTAVSQQIPQLDTATPIKLLQAAKLCRLLIDRLASLRVPDDLIRSRDSLRDRIDEACAAFQSRALEETRL